MPVGRPPYVRDHKDLPSEDPTVAKDQIEFPQAMVLTDAIESHLSCRHPNRQYLVGQDSYIYFDDTEPPTAGAKAPDWFYIPGVSPLVDGEIRRSYVMWRELIPPTIVIEFVTGDGSEELDDSPGIGMFWAYERRIQSEFYVIYDVYRLTLKVFRLVGGKYVPVLSNDRGHFEIESLGVEMGLWRGLVLNLNSTWLRWWDLKGNLLVTSKEWLSQNQSVRQPSQRTDSKSQRVERLAARLRELGIDPDNV